MKFLCDWNCSGICDVTLGGLRQSSTSNTEENVESFGVANLDDSCQFPAAMGLDTCGSQFDRIEGKKMMLLAFSF